MLRARAILSLLKLRAAHCGHKAGHLLLSISVNPTHCVVASWKFPPTFMATGVSIGPNEVYVLFCWFYMLAQNADRAQNGDDEEMRLVISTGKGFLVKFWSGNEKVLFVCIYPLYY